MNPDDSHPGPSKPRFVLGEISDDEDNAVSSRLSTNSTSSSFIFDTVKQKMMEKVQSEATDPPASRSLPAFFNQTPSNTSNITYTVKVANQDEFDPNYDQKLAQAKEALEESATKQKSASVIAKPTHSAQPSNSTKPEPAPETKNKKPLSNVIITVSGIGPERSELGKIVMQLGGSYSHPWIDNVPSGQTLLLIVDAASSTWQGTPKHQSAAQQNVSIVDKSWILACQKANLNVPITSYIVGNNKTIPSSSISPNQPSITGFMNVQKTTIKSEGGSFDTSKKAKGDEEEDSGPDEYLYDDFLVPDDYEDDSVDNVGEWEYQETWNPDGFHMKPAVPFISLVNKPPLVIMDPDEIARRWKSWIEKSSKLLGAPVDGTTLPSSSYTKSSKDESKFGMDIDESLDNDMKPDDASDATNEIDQSDLPVLHSDM